MPRRRRHLLRTSFVVILLILVVAIAGAWLTLRAGLAVLSGQRVLTGLSDEAIVTRDALGVATIRAHDLNDTVRALGYVHAQERFFEMDLMRRLASGEVAELFGSAALEIDKTHRPFRMRARAVETLASLPPADRDALSAYAQGVNAGLADMNSRPWEYWLVGSKPAEWQPVDSLLVIDAMFLDLNDSSNGRELAFAHIKDALGEKVYKFLATAGGPLDAPLIGPVMPLPTLPTADDIDLRKVDPALLRVPPPPSEKAATVGSNGFAVGGSLTTTHAALVAGDMHLSLRVPNIWFRTQMIYPNPRHPGEELNLTGVTLPGVPALVVGSNRRIAWTFTNSYGDFTDWVRVTIDPADKTHYRDANGPQALNVSNEIIKVHNGADEKLEVTDTRWGPIMAKDADGTPLALAWTALQPGGLNLNFLRMATAETVDEAMDVAHDVGMPAQNLVVGDHAGNVGWTISGKIPKRIGNYDPELPSDWSQPGTGWDGWLATADYPRLSNPAGQRIWTANQRILDFESADYARLGDSGYDLGARARQIRADLQAHDRFAPDDMLTIQLDDRALLLRTWRDLLIDVEKRAGDASPLVTAKKYVDDWNEHADPKSVGYRLTREFRREVIDTVMDGFGAAVRAKDKDFKMPKLSQAEGIVTAIIAKRPEYLLPPGYSDWNDLLLKCAERVVTKLDAMPGGLASRTWGDANATRIRHPLSKSLPGMGWLLDMPQRELPGDSNMPRVQTPDFGASERFAVEPGFEQYGYFHMPGGQSDNPLSPFYGAGDEDWAKGRATPFLPGVAKYSFILMPK
jgi:penicillin G amidase